MLSFQSIPVAAIVAIAVIAYLAHRWVAHRWFVKGARPDLSAEVRTEQESLRKVVEALPAQLALAKQRRMAKAEAAGTVRSEAIQQWLSELSTDLLEANHLESHLPAADTDYAGLSDMELDIRLLEIFALALRANGLAHKYHAWLSAEDGDRAAEGAGRERFIDETEALSEPAQVRHPHMPVIAPS
ncbi:MAG TPA: hypothetical protein VNR70_03415 [Steroidobacteraceae bacterium]|nr:hypothetical protein [Steroidobacteraceae bacterium]